jgi:hypothetical protein
MSLAQQNASQQSVHLTGGILRHFQAFSTPKQNPALEVLSTPAHTQYPAENMRGGSQAVERLYMHRFQV